MPDNAIKYSEVQVPQYRSMKDKWEQFRIIEASGEPLIRAMKMLPEEDKTALGHRQMLAVDFFAGKNHIQHQIDILAQGGIGIKVTNNDDLNDIFQATKGKGVNGRGQTLINFLLNDVLRTALTYGRTFVVVDRQIISSVITESQAASLEAPYAYTLTPLQVPAWKNASLLGRQMAQVIFKSSRPSKTDALGFASETEPAWTFWNQDTIAVQDIKGKPITQFVHQAAERLKKSAKAKDC